MLMTDECAAPRPTAIESDIATYRERVRECVESGLLESKEWNNPKWKELALSTEWTENLCNDAHHHHMLFFPMCIGLDATVRYRTVKNPRRVQEKFANCERDSLWARVHSDLMGCRVTCEVKEFPKVIDNIRSFVAAQNGVCVLRRINERAHPLYGSCMNVDTGRFEDIVQFVHVYIPQFKYIMEIQICHPHAGLVFSINSLIRQHRTDSPSLDARDIESHLWQSYETKKREILEKANE